jgi:hypothetical protein
MELGLSCQVALLPSRLAAWVGQEPMFVTGANDNLLSPLICYSRSAGAAPACSSLVKLESES